MYAHCGHVCPRSLYKSLPLSFYGALHDLFTEKRLYNAKNSYNQVMKSLFVFSLVVGSGFGLHFADIFFRIFPHFKKGIKG